MPQGARNEGAKFTGQKREECDVAAQDINQMNVIALVLIAGRPHQASATDNACAERAGKLVRTLAERSMTPGIGRSR